jgi:hypothetical protein
MLAAQREISESIAGSFRYHIDVKLGAPEWRGQMRQETSQ